MMKKILLAGLLLLTVSALYAQQKTGFSNPENIEPLLDYRLPDWGFSNFGLNLLLDGRKSNSQIITSFDNSEEENRNFAIRLNPNYNLFRESEKRILSVNSNISIRYNSRLNEFSNGNSSQETKRFDGDINLNIALREYITPDLFLLVNESARLTYDDNSFERKNDGTLINDEDNFDREILSITKLGIGTGRVRNVTPVIRAIRLRERYGVLADGKSLSNRQVRSAADMFTKFDGYQRRYDRPEKYFWQAMDQAINESVSGLEPFDLFYLTDVLEENLGRRLEGWDLSAGGQFGYFNNLLRADDQLESGDVTLERSLDISKSAGIFAETRWFKNVSLKHQLGFTTSANRSYPIHSDDILNWTTVLQARLSWLWNVGDQLLLNTRLSNNYEAFKLDGDQVINERRRWTNISGIGSNLTYFIENRFAISADISYNLFYQGNTESENTFDTKNTALRFNAGLQYYFSRILY